MASKSNSNEPVLIGRIVATFGLRGQVKIEPFTNIPERFKVGAVVLLEGVPVEILESRIHKGRYIVRLEGLKKIEEAEKLQWKPLYASPEAKVELDDDEYMVEDLIGLQVITSDGRKIGVVEDVQTYPAHDVLVVGELLIPAVQEFVELVDFDEETITVRLIEGMLDPA